MLSIWIDGGLDYHDPLQKYYEDLSEKYQQIIPLEKVYILAPREE